LREVAYLTRIFVRARADAQWDFSPTVRAHILSGDALQ